MMEDFYAQLRERLKEMLLLPTQCWRTLYIYVSRQTQQW